MLTFFQSYIKMRDGILGYIAPFLLNAFKTLVPHSAFNEQCRWKRLLMIIISAYETLLERTAFLSPDIMQAIQRRRAQKLIRKAFNSPWWRSRLQSCGISRNIRVWDDFQRIIPVTREELAVGPRERLLTSPYSPDLHLERRTSGTTGAPLTLFIDKKTYYLETAGYYARMLAMYGISFRRLARHPFFFTLNYYDPRTTMFYPFLKKGFYINFSTERIELRKNIYKIIDTIAENGGGILFTYPSDLLVFVQYLEEIGATPPIQLVMTTGQHLEEGIRRYAEYILNCPVVSYYGNQEAAILAVNCSDNRHQFHIMSERILIEIVDHNNHPLAEGITGYIIITCLDFTLFPIIRYRTGDRGRIIPGLCSCGYLLPRIEFEGRDVEFIQLPDGIKIPERHIRTIFLSDEFIRKVQRFQIRQDSLNMLVVRIVPTQLWSDADAETVTRIIGRILSGSMRVRLSIESALQEEAAKPWSFIPLNQKDQISTR